MRGILLDIEPHYLEDDNQETNFITTRMSGKWVSLVLLNFLSATHGKTTISMFDSIRMPATMFKPEATLVIQCPLKSFVAGCVDPPSWLEAVNYATYDNSF